jgi:hypothetical protein
LAKNNKIAKVRKPGDPPDKYRGVIPRSLTINKMA